MFLPVKRVPAFLFSVSVYFYSSQAWICVGVCGKSVCSLDRTGDSGFPVT